jgi:hypothetical protein
MSFWHPTLLVIRVNDGTVRAPPRGVPEANVGSVPWLGAMIIPRPSRGWHVLRVFWKTWVQGIPRLGVGNEQFETWPKPTGVIQTGRNQANDPVLDTFATSESGTTLGTKAALVMAAGQARRPKMLNRAFNDSKRANWHNDGRRIRTAGGSLTIAAMAFDHEQWLRGTFVTHRAADTAAGKWRFHNAAERPSDPRRRMARRRHPQEE